MAILGPVSLTTIIWYRWQGTRQKFENYFDNPLFEINTKLMLLSFAFNCFDIRGSVAYMTKPYISVPCHLYQIIVVSDTGPKIAID
jgi:hypothetical protein